jgi:hypothetical protein
MNLARQILGNSLPGLEQAQKDDEKHQADHKDESGGHARRASASESCRQRQADKSDPRVDVMERVGRRTTTHEDAQTASRGDGYGNEANSRKLLGTFAGWTTRDESPARLNNDQHQE